MIPALSAGVIAGPRGLFEIVRQYGSLPNVSSGSVSFSLPTGDEGQLLVAHIGFRGSASFSMPSGWTQIAQVVTADTATGGEVSGLLAYKVRGASESAPTFTRGGGSRATGCIVGYTASAGGFAFDASSSNAQGTATTTLAGAAITVGAAGSLVVAMGVMADYDVTPSTTFAAASLSALPPIGSLAAPGSVVDGRWANLFFNAQLSPTPRVSTHGWDVGRVPSGSTGAFSGSATVSSRGLVIAASFVRVP